MKMMRFYHTQQYLMDLFLKMKLVIIISDKLLLL